MKMRIFSLVLLYSGVTMEAVSDKGQQSATNSRGSPAFSDIEFTSTNDPSVEPLLVKSQHKNTMQRFCESMKEIEQLREHQLEQLKSSFHVDKLPSDISSLTDPTLKPFLNPKVRAVVEAFPFQAEAILKKNQLDSDEFNRMLDRTKRNASFRRKVEKEMKRAAKQDQKAF